MSIRSFLGAMVFLLPGISIAATSGPAIPDTSAGHALGSWLDAFNSGDGERIKSFDDAHAPWLTLDRAMELRAHTGGYELLSIEGSGKLWIVFRAREKAGESQISGTLVVNSENPAAISELSLAPAGARSGDYTVNDAERARVIESAEKLVSEYYVYPDIAKNMSEAIKTQQKRGDYRTITDSDVFATRLTDDLRVISHDRHISVNFSSEIVPPDDPNRRPDSDPKLGQQAAASNCGFEKAEHLTPNVGYLKLNMFAEPKFCAPTAIAAINFLADSDALILDVRDNHGGAPPMVALICSYLFGEPTHLGDIYDRQQNTTEQSWTFPYLPGKRFTGKPVYVLTSRRTFSAAEEFSYDLKSLKRAILIGETTGGGAHTVAPHRLNDHFYIMVPFGRFVNAITKTDWEGTGVEPDIKVAAADALDEALKRARDQTPSAKSSR
jgi:C-terminal processing protease CtpA/Prc